MRAMSELERSLENDIKSSRTGERGLSPQSASISVMEQESPQKANFLTNPKWNDSHGQCYVNAHRAHM